MASNPPANFAVLPHRACITVFHRFRISNLECHDELRADIERHGERGTKQRINNVKGINSQFLLPIDPIRIIVPTLHVPMGLVVKVLEHHLNWLQLKLEKLTGVEQMIRQQYCNSMAVLAITQWNLDDARA